MKVIGTNTFFPGKILDKLKAAGHEGSHNQFRIICKCKSMADANRKVNQLTKKDKTFQSDWSTETRNKKELDLCEQSDAWVSIDQIGSTYVSMEELLKSE